MVQVNDYHIKQLEPPREYWAGNLSVQDGSR